MKANKSVRKQIIIDRELEKQIKGLAVRDSDPLNPPTFSELIRRGMRYWIAAGAPMDGSQAAAALAER